MPFGRCLPAKAEIFFRISLLNYAVAITNLKSFRKGDVAVKHAEEPDEGNLQVRCCEGRKVLLQGRILWHSSIEREEKRRIQSMPK